MGTSNVSSGRTVGILHRSLFSRLSRRVREWVAPLFMMIDTHAQQQVLVLPRELLALAHAFFLSKYFFAYAV